MQDAEAALPVRHQSRAWCWCMCLGLALMLSGVVIGGVYLYHYHIQELSSQPRYNWEVRARTLCPSVRMTVFCF